MRAQTQFLIRGTQLIAVLTFGAGFAKQQIKTSHITNSDLAVRNDPVKDFVEIPHSEYSSSLTHRPSPPRRSATFSSIKSTTTIRSFLVKRGLANKSNKQSWHDDVSPQDAHEDTPLDGVSAHADPESEGLAFESRVRRDVSDPLEDFDDQVSEISTKQSAWQHQEDGGKDETDNLNDDLMVPHAFLIHQIPWQLHQESIALFLELSGSLNCSEQLHDHEDDLRGDLARLLLWGESFDGGKLDDILAGSAELRDVVLELCATVSEILIEEVIPRMGKTNHPAAERIEHLLGIIQQAEEEGKGNGSEATKIQTSFRRESHRSMADAAEILHSSVDCLMRLLPTMEISLAFH